MTGQPHLNSQFAKHTISYVVVNKMDDYLVIDSSGAWIRKTAQLIAEKPLLPSEHCSVISFATDRPFDSKSDQNGDTCTVLLEY